LSLVSASMATLGALHLVYVRSAAYLATHQYVEAAAEFQKILDRRSVVLGDPMVWNNLDAAMERSPLMCSPSRVGTQPHLHELSRVGIRFWIAVLLAAFPCYRVLLWLPTRPPRMMERRATQSGGLIRRFNLQVILRGGIQLNTFRSGHSAASLATALAV